MVINLTRHTKQALYLQVADQLRAKIEQGELTPQTRLPASRVLAKQLGVNRITIINAYAELEAEGFVFSRKGSGTFVSTIETDPVDPFPDDPYHPPMWENSLTQRGPQSANQMVSEMMRLARQPGVISFASGTPANEYLPVNDFRRALNDVLRHDGAEALQYEEAAGYFPLRAYIADQLQTRNIQANANNILITAGCQQAVDIVLRVLAQGEDNTIIVEDPCYLGLLDQLAARRITPIGIPVDEQGLQVDQLEQLILRHRPRLIFVTPSFHNPTGCTMSLERRQALLDIATRYGVPILEDVSYEELYYNDSPLPTLKSLDKSDLVFHTSGYSKTLAPGIRIGYLVVPTILSEQMVATKQTADILTAPLNQRALYTYLKSGQFLQHLQKVRAAYQTRRDTMIEAAKKYLPAEATWDCPDGGIYLWMKMPAGLATATDLYLSAVNQGVAFAIGSVFSANNSCSQAMRLNFACHTPETITEGMRRLGQAWQALLKRQQEQPSQISHRPAVHIL